MFDEKDKKIAAESEACRLFDAQVADYLEGEDRPVVLAHAKECAFCGVLLADLQGLMVQSQEMPLVDPPARVWANIRATLAAEGVLREQGTLWERWFSRLTLFGSPAAVGALAALVVLAVGLSVSRNVVGPRPAAVKPAPIATQETVALSYLRATPGRSRVEKAVDTTAAPLIRLSNLTGHVTVKDWEKSQVHLVSVSASPRIEGDVEQFPPSGRAAKMHFATHILDPQLGDKSTDYSLDVPLGSSLQIRNPEGSVQIQTLQGEASLDSVGGTISVSDVAGHLAI